MTARRLNILKRGLRNSKGTAAIEFAMIAPIFFMLFFAITESGLAYFANMTLENGVAESARLIRTGQAQGLSITKAQFRDIVCEQIEMLMSCDSDKLYIDVRAFSSFGGAGFQNEFDEDGNINEDLDAYQLGQSSAAGNAQDIVLVRAFYKWPLFTPGFAEYYSNMPNGDNYHLISSSFAFRNEPF